MPCRQGAGGGILRFSGSSGNELEGPAIDLRKIAMERQEFLNQSARAGVAAWTALSASRVSGANDRLRVGLIGCGGRGTFDARLMRGTPEDIQAVAPENYHNGNLDASLKQPRNVEIATLCDV